MFDVPQQAECTVPQVEFENMAARNSDTHLGQGHAHAAGHASRHRQAMPDSEGHPLVSMMSLWAATSSSVFGLYFSTHGCESSAPSGPRPAAVPFADGAAIAPWAIGLAHGAYVIKTIPSEPSGVLVQAGAVMSTIEVQISLK